MANYDTIELLLPILYKHDKTMLPVFERIERTRYLQGSSCGGNYERQCNLLEDERPCVSSFYPATNGKCYKHCGEYTNACCLPEVKFGSAFYTPDLTLGDDGCYTHNIFGHKLVCHNDACRKIKTTPEES